MQDMKIREALVDILYNHSSGVLFTNLVVPIPAALVLRNAVPTHWLIAWIGAVYFLTAIRIFAARRFFRREKRPGSTMSWAWLAASFSWVSGLLWGMLGWIGYHAGDPHLFAFGVIVLSGVACGSVPALSAFPPALIGSLITTVLPVAWRCFMAGGEIYVTYLFFLACLVGINIAHGRVTHRALWETVRLRFERQDLISQLQEERDRVASADRAKTRFLAAASHDLRQPIHALTLFISTLSALARKGAVGAADARSLADKMRSVTTSLSGLLNTLLDISKLDAGIVTPVKEDVSLDRLFRDFHDEFAGEARARGLRWRVVETSAWVHTDPMMLKRILGNLLSNAFRYTNAGGVLLGCRRRGGNVEIQVLDTGIGISRDQHAVVFDEFVQLHNPERDREKGLGLGLSIVRRTARLLGHPIRFTSELGRGSMFSVTAPRVAAPATFAQVDDVPHGASLGIMIVDDERSVLDALTQLLTVWGHRVYAGRSAAEAERAYAAAGRGKLDLIIVDYRLEADRTGVEAAREIADNLNRQPPVIILTGDTSPARLKEASASGYRLLHKPVDDELLRKMILTIGAGPSLSD